jgi:hypothetical protein
LNTFGVYKVDTNGTNRIKRKQTETKRKQTETKQKQTEIQQNTMSAIGLPVGWVKKRSTHKNKSYYFNLDNGHTQWTHPSDGIRDENGQLERLKPMVAGWCTEYCTIHKLWYYYLVNTNHSQWTHPSYGVVYNTKKRNTYKYAELPDTHIDDENDTLDYIDDENDTLDYIDYSNYGCTYDSY